MNVEQLVREYGYLTVLILTFFEGESVVLLAAFAAAQGWLNPILVGLAGMSGGMCGDQAWFMLGRRFGPAIFRRFPKWQPKVQIIAERLHRHKNLVMLSFRFFYGLRNPTPFVIGTTTIRWWHFLALNAIGALIWAASFTAAGFFFGRAVEPIIKYIHLILLGGLTVVVGFVIWRVRRRRAAQVAGADATAAVVTPPAP